MLASDPFSGGPTNPHDLTTGCRMEALRRAIEFVGGQGVTTKALLSTAEDIYQWLHSDATDGEPFGSEGGDDAS